ncbi:hypothetical protein L2E82_45683 [Cichorium intybus]|uniref:Uncharacterized protein n=1 Tax=Cichorium intybus TaxID=13427 RepID=A0ACB8ZUJ9_CICIN|nr:hypothetical protein L2E82_45683 [Cichorium intybus]
MMVSPLVVSDDGDVVWPIQMKVMMADTDDDGGYRQTPIWCPNQFISYIDLLFSDMYNYFASRRVEVTRRGNVRRKYRISRVTSEPTRELMFPFDEERNMKSVVYYFREVYGFRIRHKVINGSVLNYWACINFSRTVPDSASQSFCHQLVQMCHESGMVFIELKQYLL